MIGIDVIFKIAAIGLLIAIISQVLKKSDRDDIATMVSIAGLIIVLTMIISTYIGVGLKKLKKKIFTF